MVSNDSHNFFFNRSPQKKFKEVLDVSDFSLPKSSRRKNASRVLSANVLSAYSVAKTVLSTKIQK